MSERPQKKQPSGQKPEEQPNYQREVEKKFVVQGPDAWGRASTFIMDLGLIDHDNVQESYDQFWKSPNVDFVRLRQNTKELTVKVTDRGTTTDRIEENVVVSEYSMKTAERLLTLLHGPPCLQLTKRFIVYYSSLPVEGLNAVICLYTIEGDPEKRVFLEVEAASIDVVNAYVVKLQKDLTLVQEQRSLFQIFNLEVTK